jgi:quinolinate synthase
MKHTKGKINKRKESNAYIIETEETIIAELPAWTNKTELEANAKRIVKCWNMHDEMLKFFHMLDEALNDGLEVEKDDPIHNVAKRIIKKATE